MENPNDPYCVERVLDGETEFFSVLADGYSKPLFAWVVRITGDREDTEEVVQDAFLKAFRSLRGFRKQSEFRTWLYRIAYNTAVSAARRKKRPCVAADEGRLSDWSDGDGEEDFRALRERRFDGLERALGRLPPCDRALVGLFYEQEVPVAEMARMTGLSESNVKTKLFRIRGRLCRWMTEYEKQ